MNRGRVVGLEQLIGNSIGGLRKPGWGTSSLDHVQFAGTNS